MKDDFAKALVNAPQQLLVYVVGMVIATLTDYTLITLAIFAVLLGLVVHSALIAATAFFGLYFALRLVANVAEVIGLHANRVGTGSHQQAQATMQVAAALAQLIPSQEVLGDVVEGDILP